MGKMHERFKAKATKAKSFDTAVVRGQADWVRPEPIDTGSTFVIGPNTREFKYLVAFNHETQRFHVGYTRTWKFHHDIMDEFPKGCKPYGAGYFTVEIEEGSIDWEVDTVVLGKSSEGFKIGPSRRDLDMVKKMLQAENNEEFIRVFTKEGEPVES